MNLCEESSAIYKDSNGDCHKCSCDAMASDVHLQVPRWAVDFGFVSVQFRVAVVRGGVGATSWKTRGAPLSRLFE